MRSCILGPAALRRTIVVLLTFAAAFAYIQLSYMDSWSGSLQLYHRNITNETTFGRFRDANDGNKYKTREVSFEIGRKDSSEHLPFNDELNSPTDGDVLPLQFTADAATTDYTSTPLMLLFSSWVHSEEKADVHAAVIRLWSAWPYIQNAVVTGDHVVKQHALEAGWHVEPVTHVHKDCYGPPVLSPMFTHLKNLYTAHFYGFSNSDILFGNGLAETMRFVYEHNAWRTKPLLIVGRRHNVDFIDSSNVSLQTPSDVEKLTKIGKLVIRSTDYFFTNNHFPWRKVPEVSIGRPYVVRAIIGFALKRKIAVLDATKTIEAVHLTTQDGNLASWHKKGVKCNEKIMSKIKWSVPIRIGHCECALLETFKDNGEIKVRHRKANATICS